MEATVKNTIVLIPSYNESRTIGKVVRDITGIGLNVLVIDDGSIDNTEREALDGGAMVIRNRMNIGKGYALREGFKQVFEKMNYEWLIMMDGDGQHHPEDIPALMDATKDDDIDLVNGNRMLYTRNMPFIRYGTNRFTSWVLSSMCGQEIPDSQCGFRLIRIDALKKIDLTSDKYDIESEILIKAARQGLKIRSVPVATIYGDEVSGINRVRDTIRFFRLIFKYLLKKNAR
jgi:glycosyltransferase involved in cell wall biosynthesis